MKSKRIFNALITISCLLINAIAINIINAQTIDTVQAKLAAKNFFVDRLSRSRQLKLKAISTQNLEMFLVHEEKGNISKQNDFKKSSQTFPLYYIFNVKNKINSKDKNGFIIISADQRIHAVLGYSFTEEFSENDQSPAFKEWMNHYKEQIIYAIQNNLTPDPAIRDIWKQYSNKIEFKSTKQLSEVEPLISTKWSQRSYYNNLCPADADISCTGSLNGHVPAGCVAVAMAQIMKYWKYPVTNNPITGYDDPLSYYDDGTSITYGWIPDVGETTYDWDNMPDIIDIAASPDPEQIDAVSTLIYHCGVAVQMNYGPPSKGSGAGSSINAFKDYFKYSPDIQDIDRSNYDNDEDWVNILKNELDNNRPVYYSGYQNDEWDGGHAFVCDGYQDIEPYFHFNFGFGGGGGDAYYYLNDLTPGSRNFNYKQWAIIGITKSALPLFDVDGNGYNIVEIGSQVWMAENLKTTKYNDGTLIPNVTGNTAWAGLNTDAYCWYNNDAATYKGTYGALYNWYTANTGKLCPTGWHVPSSVEWSTFENYLIFNGYNYDGTTSGNNYAKALASTTLWTYSENTGAVGNTDYPSKRNATGFSAVPSGYRSSIGPFNAIEEVTAWWSSSRYNSTYPGERWMAWSTPNLSWAGDHEQTGNPVRCLKNATAGILPVDAGVLTYDNIGTAGEENWYRFLTGMAGTYVIQTYGSTDTYMYLFDSDQTSIITEDNDGAGSGNNSKIVQNLNANTWYYIKIRGYNNSVTGSYSIGVNALPASPTAGNVTVTYDGLFHNAEGSVPNGILIVWYDAAAGGNVTTQPTGKDFGNYTAFAEAVNNVTGYTSALRTQITLTINRRLATWTTNANHKTYGDMDPSPLTTGSGNNFVKADGITATYNRESGETVGDYHITATLSPAGALNNYTIANTGATFTIDKKVASVTPNAASKYCGQMDPVFTGTLTGFLSSDEVSATYSRTAGETVEGSPYTISATLSPVSVVNNYSIAYYTNNFTIMGVSIDASQSSNPVQVGSPSITLSAKVLDANSIPVPGVEVWFSIENGNNQITNYPAVFTAYDGSGVATLTLNGLTSMVDVFKVIVVAGSGCGDAATSVAYLAVYDPTGGFVTGGGWINSPAGAYHADPALTGKVNFGFVSKYKKGSNIPDGNTVFQFHAGDLNFSSLSYDLGSLVIVGYKAIYKGAGTINGISNYKFMVSAVDGDLIGDGGYDKFRVKIWNKTDNSIVYDSNLGGDENDEPLNTLGGGSIVIHKANEKAPKSIQIANFGLNVYPNPFTDHIYFDLQLMTNSKVRLEIYDIRGSKIATVYNDIVVANVGYRFEYVPENFYRGALSYRLIVDERQMFSGTLIHK